MRMIKKIPSPHYDVLSAYAEKNNLFDVVKVTHITGTTKYILHPETSDDVLVDVGEEDDG